MARPLFLVLASVAVASVRGQTLSFRSPEVDGGSSRWTMLAGGGRKDDGAAFSMPGFDPRGWSRAIVPGTVLNSMVANGALPEPYFGTNNLFERRLIPDLSEVGPDYYTAWFRTEFALPRSFSGRQAVLQLDGINYRAEVWLNGRRVGDMAGMFRRGRFNVTPYLRANGPNALAVLVRPPDVPGGPKSRQDGPRAPGENRNGGDGRFGRNVTMLMSAGWDFTFSDGVRDRNTGIWRDVKLVASGPVALRNPYVQTELRLPDAVETPRIEAENVTDQPQRAVVRLRVPGAKADLSQEIALAPHETKEVRFAPFTVRKARLWWPLNKGEQALYDLQAEATVDGRASDALKTRFGIRTITSDQNTPDKSRMFYVNGKRFFVRGSNWIPEAMLRTSDARTEAELRYTAQSGVNFLRQWGGGIAESDRFYELCDELGIVVWTEFWQTGDTDKPADAALYRANVEDTVKRIRIHASNGYYVSANERSDIVPIKDLLDALDPATGYQVQSETAGIHDGSPYKYVNPMFYYDDTASARGSRINGFCPEYGTVCLPTADCLREMMDEKDLWPINPMVWNYLDGNGFHGVASDYAKAVGQYGPSKGIDEFARKAQLVGMVGYRGIWESWNRNRYEYGDRFGSGVLFWYHNSPARQVAGRMWDWSLEPTAALYATQNALEPVHAQFDFLRNTVGVNNERVTPLRGVRVRARVLDLSSKVRLDVSKAIDLPADGVTNDVLRIDFPADITPVHFVRLDLLDAKGKPIAQSFYWRSSQAYAGPKTLTGPLYGDFESLQSLPPASIRTEVRRGARRGKPVWTVRLANPGDRLAFLLQAKLVDDRTGKPVRPAFYSDNFVSLLPGESRTITIEAPAGTIASVRVEGWNASSGGR